MLSTVLVAAANGDLSDNYQRLFSNHGWQVQMASDGLECLGKLRDFSPDLLILDLHLPWGGWDGVLAVMRDDPRLTRVPVLVASVLACPETR